MENKNEDKKIKALREKEQARQLKTISLIPSENHMSSAVLDAYSSVFANKYSEGYPGKRYYPGNKYVDELENLTRKRALNFFGLSEAEWGVNVQPYSGSIANFAIYRSMLKPGDTALGMSLAQGGHLTHGHKVSATGYFFNFTQYGLNEKEMLDFNEIEALVKELKPKIIVCGATAYSREIDFERFGELAKKYNAYLLADISHIAGLVATKFHKSPFPYADFVMTTTHKTLRGPRGAIIFSKKEYAEKIDKGIMPGLQGGPHNNTIAAMSIALYEALKPSFKEYTRQIIKNAKTLSEELKEKGYKIVSGGTDNHLLLLDLTDTGITGMEAETLLENAGITANRNTVPKETRSPFNPSGIRMGTPAATTRGMKEAEMKLLAVFIDNSINKKEVKKTKEEVQKLAIKFPPPPFNNV